LKEKGGLGDMKCPKCESKDTKKVSVLDVNWKPGQQHCNSCWHTANWSEFMEPPFMTLKVLPTQNDVLELQFSMKHFTILIENYINRRIEFAIENCKEDWFEDDYNWTHISNPLLIVRGDWACDVWRMDMCGEKIHIEYTWYDKNNYDNDEEVTFPTSHLYEYALDSILKNQMKAKNKKIKNLLKNSKEKKQKANEKLERQMLAKLKAKYE